VRCRSTHTCEPHRAHLERAARPPPLRRGHQPRPDFVGPAGVGPASFAASIDALRAGFPDLSYTLEDVVAGADRVAVRWTVRGTHTGQFRSFAPTGKTFANAGFAIFRIADGKIVAAWVQTDRLAFLQALGVIPDDPRFGPAPPAAR
jgi:predicted ester cyclase